MSEFALSFRLRRICLKYCLPIAILLFAALVPPAQGASPKIPGMTLRNGFHTVEMRLPAWDRFFGTAKTIPFIIYNDELKNIDATHVRAHEFVVKNEEAILRTILRALLEKYPEWQELYAFEGDEAAIMPNVSGEADFARLLKPTGIYVLSVARNGMPYIGYEFSATWDEENGFGAMMHELRLVEIGAGDTAVLTWIAEGDLINSRLEETGK